MALAELDDIGEAIGLAAKVDFAGLPGVDVEAAAIQVQELKAKLAALEAATVGAYDVSMHWSIAGHRGAAAALRHRCRMRGGHATGSVGLARKLRSMPATAAALADGTITEPHARRLAFSAIRPEFADAEAFLIRKAKVLSFTDWERAVSYWEQVVDEARRGDDPDPPDPREVNRSLHLSKTLDGMGRLDGWLDPVGAGDVKEALRRIEREFFKADWALAKETYGDKITVDALWRTPAQRRADALVEMARRSVTAPKDGKRPRPLTIVHVDHHTFDRAIAALFGERPPAPDPDTQRLCELDNGTVISPTQMIEQAIIGDVRRLVYGAPGVILDYGRKVRLFEGALREAICARDRRCGHEGCEIPARECEIDHIEEWNDGGITSHRNGKAKCSFHHRRHKHGPG
jgi:Domain of unknown function (DUF222)